MLIPVIPEDISGLKTSSQILINLWRYVQWGLPHDEGEKPKYHLFVHLHADLKRISTVRNNSCSTKYVDDMDLFRVILLH